MKTLEQTTNEILTLEKMWQPNDGNIFPWAPFGDDLTIASDCLAPHSRLKKARVRVHAQIHLPLEDQYADDLRVIWEGDAAAHVGAPYFHSYSIARSRPQYWRMWENHPLGQALHRADVWACRNLKDAGEKYSWTGTALSFPLLALALQAAVHQGDELRTAAVCLKILEWGGVRDKPGRMRPWLFERAHAGMLCGALVDATARLIPQSCEALQCFDGDTYLMNSSSTKLYAAMALDLSSGLQAARQDVLIYDARVAAGLALITRIMLQHSGTQTMPRHLRFPVEKANGSRRDPSCLPFLFLRFSNSADSHYARAKFARIGSRYIQKVTGLPGPSGAFALAEKGLFMIGYDIRSQHGIPPEETASREVKAPDSSKRKPTTGTGSDKFKRRAVELHKSGRTQLQAIMDAARELNIVLKPSYKNSPGSHFGRWREQGIF